MAWMTAFDESMSAAVTVATPPVAVKIVTPAAVRRKVSVWPFTVAALKLVSSGKSVE